MYTPPVTDVPKNPSPKRKVGRPPKGADKKERKPLILQMRGETEWKTWLEEAAKKDGRSLAAFMERAAMLYAREIGFTKEPPDR